MPRIELCLQVIALGEQCGILRRQVTHDGGEATPELLRCNAAFRQGFAFDERVQRCRDLQTFNVDSVSHGAFGIPQKNHPPMSRVIPAWIAGIQTAWTPSLATGFRQSLPE